jgi:hypothetical protein
MLDIFIKFLTLPCHPKSKDSFSLGETTDAPAAQYLKIFTKNLVLRANLPDEVSEVEMVALTMLFIWGAWSAVQNFCAASGDFARPFRMYGLRARSGYNDLVDHAHECGWRDVLAIRIFGRRLPQVSDLCRTA